jgi:hypothetical protein
MAGAVFERQLNKLRPSRAQFDLANHGDDADIRRLLRSSPMQGSISLSLEREPNYFADAGLPGEEKQTIVARESGRIVCAGSCTVRTRFVNGERRRVGYPAGLRLDASVAGRFDILRRGYQFFRELQADAPADFYFTSIAADNSRAREFLERGLAGMPVYEWIGDFVTALLPVPRGKKNAGQFRSGENNASFMEEISSFLNLQGRNQQLAPCWSAEEVAALQPLGLKAENFHILREGGGTTACAALWDQRCFKQTVIKGYAPWLARVRPVINATARVSHMPHLPPAGSALAHAFVSHFAMTDECPENFRKCIDAMLAAGRCANLEFITMGFASNDPRLAALDAGFRTRKYRSRIYTVRWPGIGGAARDLDGRILSPEVALL